MKLSITTFKLICSCWNEPQEILEDIEYLLLTIESIDRNYLNYTKQEQQTAKKEINKLIKTL